MCSPNGEEGSFCFGLKEATLALKHVANNNSNAVFCQRKDNKKGKSDQRDKLKIYRNPQRPDLQRVSYDDVKKYYEKILWGI